MRIVSHRRQRTLRRPAEVSGIGFVTGASVRVRFLPAPPDSGVVFVRTDLSPPVVIPAGVARVYKADATGAQQFVGEDRIDHTPKDENVRVKLGDAFDVVAERKQTDYKNIARRVFEYPYEIRIRNHKEEAVTVVVNEPIGGDWEIVNPTFPAEKTAAFAARFNVPVAKDGEAVLSYRVRVRY